MSVKLSGIDISDRIIQRGASSAKISELVGILAQSRDYVLRDNDGEFSPFTPTGFLFRNSWRNQAIEETEVNEREFFSGSIKSVGMRLDDSGFQTIIKTREAIGTLLDFVVEENDITTATGFLIQGLHSAGDQTVNLKSGIGTIAIPSLITFSDQLIPRYQINDQNMPPQIVEIDRGLESDLVDNTPARISIPIVKTIPTALKDALVSAQFGQSIGSTFDSEAAKELAAGRTVILHIRIEDRFSLANHLATLLEMGNYNLTVSPAGIIDLVKFPGFSGEIFPDKIGPSELIPPIDMSYNDSRLTIGYDLLFADVENVKVASGDVDQLLIDEFAGKNRWQPLSAESNLSIDYKYLYTDAPTADFYGQEYLDYWGAPRVRLRASLKQSASENILKRFQLQLGKGFAVTSPVAVRQFLLEEPMRVTGFDYDEASQSYTNIELELVNFPLPNLPRVSSLPVIPDVQSVTGITDGAQVDLVIDPVGAVTGELFLLDGATIVDRKTFVITNKTGNFISARVNSGQSYKLRLFTTSSLIKSDRTDSFEFTAA